MIHFACPGCGASYSVEDRKAGKASKCRKCQTQFLIPGLDASPPPAAPPPVPPPVPAPNTGPPAVPEPGIEIVPCPGCQARLTVAAADLGRNIECPHCRTIYAAVRPGALMPGSSHQLPTFPSSTGSSHQLPPFPPPAAPPPPPVFDTGSEASKRERNLWPEEAMAVTDAPPPPRRNRFQRRKSVGGTRTITGVGVLSFAKISGALSFISGVLISLIYGFFGLIIYLIGASAVSGQARGVLGAGLLYMVCGLVIYPFILGVVGFVGGAIWALIYNVLANSIGGIEIELE